MVRSEWYSLARDTLPAPKLATFETRMTGALIAYRAETAQVISAYHESVGATWCRYGKPSTNAECQHDLNLCWEAFKASLARASHRLDAAPAIIFVSLIRPVKA